MQLLLEAQEDQTKEDEKAQAMQIQSLNNQVARLNQEKEWLETDVNTVKSANESLTEENAKLKLSVAEKDQEIESLKE